MRLEVEVTGSCESWPGVASGTLWTDPAQVPEAAGEGQDRSDLGRPRCQDNRSLGSGGHLRGLGGLGRTCREMLAWGRTLAEASST